MNHIHMMNVPVEKKLQCLRKKNQLKRSGGNVVVCEKCRKNFKRMLEVRWVESLTCGAYNYKRFDSIDDLCDG